MKKMPETKLWLVKLRELKLQARLDRLMLTCHIHTKCRILDLNHDADSCERASKYRIPLHCIRFVLKTENIIKSSNSSNYLK
jgi:hypothetical protein